ncbi:hypothetical protein ACFQ7F_43760 [Streptomyces sp. NPDC056486]|uniref:hypothetical protein n=1 Tax=Streptomyces sp. NPDC056486 TaxID=3345835 RepID=UPI0036BCC671
MAERHEVLAWLGDAAGEMTSEQIEEFAALSDEIAERYPDPDDRDEMQAALTVAHRLLVENPAAVVSELSEQRAQARQAEIDALAGLRQAALQLIPAGDRTESGFSREAHVDRMAVRAWLGK